MLDLVASSREGCGELHKLLHACVLSGSLDRHLHCPTWGLKGANMPTETNHPSGGWSNGYSPGRKTIERCHSRKLRWPSDSRSTSKGLARPSTARSTSP